MLRCFTSNGWASRRGWKNTCLSQHWLIAQVRISLLSVLMQSSQFFPFPGLFFPSYPQGSIQAQQSLPYLVFCWAKHKFSYLFSIIQTFKIFAMTRLWSPELPCQKFKLSCRGREVRMPRPRGEPTWSCSRWQIASAARHVNEDISRWFQPPADKSFQLSPDTMEQRDSILLHPVWIPNPQNPWA